MKMAECIVYFVTVIFIPIFVLDRCEARSFFGCVRDVEDRRLYRCLSRWSVFGDHREPSAFLRDESVVEDICGDGTSIASVDSCVTGTVSPGCDNILAYWRGIRDMYTFLCQRRPDFYRHSRCRNNKEFIVKFERCVSSNTQRIHAGTDFCLSVHIMLSCFTRALSEHCTPSATEFFSLVFDIELAPSMAYSQCKHFDTNVVQVQSIDDSHNSHARTHTRKHTNTHGVIEDPDTDVRREKLRPEEENDNIYREAAFALDYTSRGAYTHTPVIQSRAVYCVWIISLRLFFYAT